MHNTNATLEDIYKPLSEKGHGNNKTWHARQHLITNQVGYEVKDTITSHAGKYVNCTSAVRKQITKHLMPENIRIKHRP